MNLTRLENFKAIYEDGSVSAAARRLFIAQPALSNQLRAFEAELGVPLFERKSSALCPTAAGHALYRRAVQILSVVHASEQEMLQYRSGVKGVIRLGVVSSGGYALLTSDIHAFRARFPSIRFEIFDRNTYALRPMLQAGLIDMAIVRTPFDCEGLRVHLLEGELMAAVSLEPFSSNSLPLASLANRPFILYRRFERLFHEVCAEAGFAPEIACINDDARTTLTWARAGLGTGLVPLNVTRLFPDPALHVCAIDCELLYTHTALIHSADAELSSAAACFLDAITRTSRERASST